MAGVPDIDAVIAALDHASAAKVSAGEAQLLAAAPREQLVSSFAGAIPRMRGWRGRNAALFHLVHAARSRQEVRTIALRCLADPSWMVRMQACAILAYALSADAIPSLKKLLEHPDSRTRDHAAAAIDAISNRNHHYWVDRDHSGRCFWSVNRGDTPNGLL